ncbi:MAG: hypothetical protein MJ209_02775 [archaeon]|nr:hypothetical protein [archaeon]
MISMPHIHIRPVPLDINHYSVLIVDKDTSDSVSHENVTFDFNGKTYNAVTDDNGHASFELPNLQLGRYPVVAHCEGVNAHNVITIPDHSPFWPF